MFAKDKSQLPTMGLQKITSPSDAIFLIPDVYLSILRVIPEIKDLISLRGVSKFFKNKIDEMLFKDPQVFWKVMSQLTWNQAIGFVAYFKTTAYYRPIDTSDLRNRIACLNLEYNRVVNDDTCLVKLFTYIQGRMFVFNDSHDFIRNISNLPAAGISAFLLHLAKESGISKFCQRTQERIEKSNAHIAVAWPDKYLCYAALAQASKINIEILNKSMVEIRTVDFEQPPYANFIANLILSSKLSEPTLTEAEKKQLLSRRSPGYINLSGLDFSRHDLRGFDFSGANLTDTNFEGANLHSCDFDGAFLLHTNLKKADCRFANFSHALIDNAHRCEGGLMEDARFCYTNIPTTNYNFGSSLLAVKPGTIRDKLDAFVKHNHLHIPLLQREQMLAKVLAEAICVQLEQMDPCDSLKVLDEMIKHPLFTSCDEYLLLLKQYRETLLMRINEGDSLPTVLP